MIAVWESDLKVNFCNGGRGGVGYGRRGGVGWGYVGWGGVGWGYGRQTVPKGSDSKTILGSFRP